jgi:ribosome maturation factor RimP
MKEKLKKVKEIADSCAKELGMEIISVDFVHELGIKILRIIARKEPVMTIDDSGDLNRKISDELDAIDIFPDEYYLEVSSEGIEKELRTNSEIKEAVGEYICIKVKEKVSGKKEIYGVLLAFDDKKITVKADIRGQIKEIEIGMNQINMIRLAVKF